MKHTVKRSFWESIWPFPIFPEFSGPHRVGFLDIEWNPKKYSNKEIHEMTSSNQTPNTPQETVLVRMFYPAESYLKKERKANWLPDPSYLYAQGYGSFLNIPSYISVPLFTFILVFTRIPVYFTAKLFGTTKIETPIHQTSSFHESQFKQMKTFPLVIYSHGLGGCRTSYSSICGELASRGLIVCALEHRDGSACMTTLKDENGSTKTLPYQKKASFGFEFRNKQLLNRVEEIRACVQALEAINEGKPPENLRDNHKNSLFKKRNHDNLLNSLKGRLDMNNLFVAGHSFGSATSLESLKSEYNINFKCGIILDPWMMPLKDNNLLIQKPVIIICSQHFANWSSNHDVLLRWFRSLSLIHRSKSCLLTIKGSSHQSFSDFPTLFPQIMKWIKQGDIEPKYCMSLISRATVEFLRLNLSPPFNNTSLLPEDKIILNKDHPDRPAEVILH